MLRIQFTIEDVARTRIVDRLDPLWELVLALHMLRRQPGDEPFTLWRRQAVSTLRGAGLGGSLHMLLAIVPLIGYFPDFLNPIAALDGLDEGLDAIRSTPRTRLHQEIVHLAQSRRLPSAAERIAEGNPTALIELTDTMRACFDMIVDPYLPHIRTSLDCDRRGRMAALAHDGVRGLFDSFHPLVRWSDGELSIPGHRDQELLLDGRGLLLIPAYFCLGAPVTLVDPTLQPVLIYPAERHLGRLSEDHLPGGTLAALLGATRAAMLFAIDINHASSTTELSRHLGISAASASEHATILRQAGVITSHRNRNRVLHQPTSLGRAILADTSAHSVTHNRCMPAFPTASINTDGSR